MEPARKVSPLPETPQAPASASAAAPAASPSAEAFEPPSRKPLARRLLPVLIGLAVFGGAAAWAVGRGRESTDDAQVEGRVLSVASRVAGQVESVAVLDNQVVREGDVLVELDKRDLRARLAAATADVAAAKAALDAQRAQLQLTLANVDSNLRQARGSLTAARAGSGTSSAQVAQARADVDAANSRARLAKLELDRVARLHADGALAQAELDARQAMYDQAVASVEQARARLLGARQGISGAGGQVVTARGRLVAAQTGPQQALLARAQVATAEARVEQAESARVLAELALSYATIRAPRGGVVSRRTVEVGQNVSPERALLAIVPLDDVWVVANFKEDQVQKMKPGQRVRLHLDAYGGQDISAHVDSLAGASGARFALLPPDNASGNFVKVVQRIPVLVRLDGDPGVLLRPGMSADVTVYLR